MAILIAVLSAPGVLVLSWMISTNVGWLFICSTTSFYLLYEIMHFFCHVKDNVIVRNMPFISVSKIIGEFDYNGIIGLAPNTKNGAYVN